MSDLDSKVDPAQTDPSVKPGGMAASDALHVLQRKSGRHRPAEQRRKLVSAHRLKLMVFAPLDYIVGRIIPTGLTILAGFPKAGKSWLALDIARSVAQSISCLGQDPQPQGDVLYLALEDNLARLKGRLNDILPKGSAWPRNLLFDTDWPRADEGGLRELEAWVKQTPKARLIIIDVLERFKSSPVQQGAAFGRDYRELEALQKLAKRAKIGIVVVLHLRKTSGRRDPFEQISGTTGLTAAADTIVMLEHRGGGTRLYARGKDIENIDERVTFDLATKCWKLLETPEAASEFRERDLIVDLLKQQVGPMAPKDIAQALGQTSGAIRTMLSRMHARREVIKCGRGLYGAVSSADRQL